MITLWNLFEATLLCLNAVCVLNEKRFLAKIGWGLEHNEPQAYSDQTSVKNKILLLVRSIRMLMTIPLIFFNILMILLKLVLG